MGTPASCRRFGFWKPCRGVIADNVAVTFAFAADASRAHKFPANFSYVTALQQPKKILIGGAKSP